MPYQGDLRKDLLTAAIAMVAETDPAHFSLRAVAREVGVSHAAPKNHFEDKRALLTAIALEGFAQLLADIETVGIKDNPIDQLEHIALTYVRFARDNGGYFRVMWRSDLISSDHPDIEHSRVALFEHVQGIVDRSGIELWWKGVESQQIATAYWSMVHGLAQLHIEGAMTPIMDEDPVPVMEAATLAIRQLIAVEPAV